MSRNVLTRVLSASLSIAALSCGSLAASAQDLKLTEAERTPAKCDLKLTVADLAEYKAPKAKKPYKIELSVPSFANPYIQALIYGAEQAAKESGVTLTVDAGKGFMNAAGQIAPLENALSHKPDALLINPAEPDGLAATIDDTVDAGTPVFDVGTLSNSEKSDKLVQDDYTQGVIATDALAKLLPSGGEGIVMGGPATSSFARRRVAGFLDGLKTHPNIKSTAIVNTDIDPQEGLTKFTNAAQANPKIDFVYPVGSFLLEPQSIPAEYRKAVYVAGSLTNVTLEALKDGSAAAILPDFPISVGYVGVSLAVHKLNGDPGKHFNCIPVDAMFKADIDNPVWVKNNILPVEWVAPK
jgi:ribose transport system substrate-binding protein